MGPDLCVIQRPIRMYNRCRCFILSWAGDAGYFTVEQMVLISINGACMELTFCVQFSRYIGVV